MNQKSVRTTIEAYTPLLERDGFQKARARAILENAAAYLGLHADEDIARFGQDPLPRTASQIIQQTNGEGFPFLLEEYRAQCGPNAVITAYLTQAKTERSRTPNADTQALAIALRYLPHWHDAQNTSTLDRIVNDADAFASRVLGLYADTISERDAIIGRCAVNKALEGGALAEVASRIPHTTLHTDNPSYHTLLNEERVSSQLIRPTRSFDYVQMLTPYTPTSGSALDERHREALAGREPAQYITLNDVVIGHIPFEEPSLLAFQAVEDEHGRLPLLRGIIYALPKSDHEALTHPYTPGMRVELDRPLRVRPLRPYNHASDSAAADVPTHLLLKEGALPIDQPSH